MRSTQKKGCFQPNRKNSSFSPKKDRRYKNTYPSKWKQVRKSEPDCFHQIKNKFNQRERIMKEKYDLAKHTQSIIESRILREKRWAYMCGCSSLQMINFYLNNREEPTDFVESQSLIQRWLSLIHIERSPLSCAPDWIRKNKAVVQTIIERYPYDLIFAKSFWSDVEIVSKAVSIRPSVLEFLGDDMRNNYSVMKIAFERSMISYLYLGETLKKLPGFELLLGYQKEYCLGFGGFRLNSLDKEVSYKLREYYAYLQFLIGTKKKELAISKLELGDDIEVLKKKIFEFVGIPTGNLLWGLLTAKKYIKYDLTHIVRVFGM